MFKKIFDFLEARKSYRQTIKELNSLSDKELNDIGIGRYDIERIALDAFNKQLDSRYESDYIVLSRVSA